MSRTLSRGRVVLIIVVVMAAGVVAGWRAGAFSAAAPPVAGGLGASAPFTQPVVRADMAAVTPVAATLGYAGSYLVAGEGGGSLTWLPSPGQVISQGRALYRVDGGSPVVLLYGRIPDWRAMSEGTVGGDVAELNRNLVALRYAGRADIASAGWNYYSAETAYAVQRLEAQLGVSFPPGSLASGQVVFEPRAIRVAAVTGRLGGPASGPVLRATSDDHVVMIPLDVSQEGEVRAGDTVRVTLPDGTSTPGLVSSVGRVATTSASGSGGTTTTVAVAVRLTDPRAAGDLDQAPVTLYITTATARDVLAVPVTALLARSPGRYVVEVAGPGNSRHLVPVTVGPVFDDSSGMVQVTGALAPGQRVVVASS